MKLVCTHKCFVMGRSINSGQIVEVPESMLQTDVVKSSFDTPEAAEVLKKREDAIHESKFENLSKEEYVRRLGDMGVKIPPKATIAELKKLFVAQFDPNK